MSPPACSPIDEEAQEKFLASQATYREEGKPSPVEEVRGGREGGREGGKERGK